MTPSKPLLVFSSLITERRMRHVPIPEVQQLLDKRVEPQIHVEATFDEWRYRPWVLLHTSGSTGTPKMVTVKRGMTSTTDVYQKFLETNLMPRYGNMRVFIPFPSFHIAGINFSLSKMCWVDSTYVLPPVNVPLTADLVHQMHVHGNVQHSTLAPSLIADLVKKPEYSDGLSRLSGWTFAGGPLSDEAAARAS